MIPQKILCDKCIEKFDALINHNNAVFGQPPECMIIYYVSGKPEEYEYKVTERISAQKYSRGIITDIPADTIPDTSSAGGAFFRQAFAEYGYDENLKKAFINIYFGKRYASGYEYEIITENNEIMLINEKLLWVS